MAGGPRNRAIAGGTGVILVTGFGMGLIWAGFFNGGLVDAILGVFVVLVTLVGAWALARFVARHGDEIGEARFDTRNKDEKEG
jgi:hypothetical protein